MLIILQDGKTNSAVLVCGFLLYVGLVTKPVDALQLYAVKRTPPVLQPSHHRYCIFFVDFIGHKYHCIIDCT